MGRKAICRNGPSARGMGDKEWQDTKKYLEANPDAWSILGNPREIIPGKS